MSGPQATPGAGSNERSPADRFDEPVPPEARAGSDEEGVPAGGSTAPAGDGAGAGVPGPPPGEQLHPEGLVGLDGPAPGEPGDPLAAELPADAELPLADVAALTAERDEYLGALQRVKADFDNYRKRVLRQQEEQTARAARDLVTKLLPVLDTLDLAEAHLGSDGPEVASHEATALAQARAQLVDVLAREGLERVDETDVSFDPSVHDAVAHAPAEADEGSAGETRIDAVLRSGYRWHGQVLRPAMVRVRG
ncbi:MAG TPA: nucleotide exchange factor GrpE [Acidimicrobiales bacterium]|jgi:molecular chaperone GrpE